MNRYFKKLISVLLATLILFCATPLNGYAVKAITDNTFVLNTNEEENIISGKIGTKLSWSIDKSEKKLTIDNNGVMVSFTADVAPWLQYKQYIVCVEINDGCTNISTEAFAGCSYIETVIIPDSVTDIGDSAFAGCTNLSGITIPESVTNIGYSAFASCSSLTNVTIPDSVTSVGGSAFENCSGLETVIIGSGVTAINTYTFSDCSSLNNVFIGNSVASIGYSAFADCTSLTSISVPGSVLNIDYGAFSGCTSLTTAAIGIGMQSIGSSAFASCPKLSVVYIYSKNCKLAESALSIYAAIYGYAGSEAENFAKTYGYEFVGIDKSFCVEHIYTNVCDADCNICAESREIQHNFSGWVVSKEATCTQTGVKQRTCSVSGCIETQIIDVVPHTDKNEDGICEVCKEQLEIIRKMNGICGPNLVWTLDDTGVLTIEGTGGMYDFGVVDYVWIDPDTKEQVADGTEGSVRIYRWNEYFDEVKNVVIGDKVEAISAYAFSKCNNLEKVYIPESVIDINHLAFEGCDDVIIVCENGSYANIYAISNNIKYILNDSTNGTAFEIDNGILIDYTGSAENIFLPAEVNSVGINAFYGNNVIESVEIPFGVTKIYTGAFSACPELNRVIIPFTTTDIADSAFEGTDATVYCYYNSYAYNYAVRNDIDYELITVTLNTSSVNLFLGESVEINAAPSISLESGIPFVWKSSDPSVATVDVYGNVVAKAIGEATIGVYTPYGSVLDECMLTVSEPIDEFENIDLKFESVSTDTLRYGEKILLHINVAELPEDASIKWMSSNGAVLRISNENAECQNHEGCVTCRVESVGSGFADIIGTVVDENGDPVIRDNEEITASHTLKSKASFFWKIIAFFRQLFGLSKIIMQSV